MFIESKIIRMFKMEMETIQQGPLSVTLLSKDDKYCTVSRNSITIPAIIPLIHNYTIEINKI